MQTKPQHDLPLSSFFLCNATGSPESERNLYIPNGIEVGGMMKLLIVFAGKKRKRNKRSVILDPSHEERIDGEEGDVLRGLVSEGNHT